MKTKESELEVDFIGDQTSLTDGEKTALSDYFKKKKLNVKKAEIKLQIRRIKQKIAVK